MSLIASLLFLGLVFAAVRQVDIGRHWLSRASTATVAVALGVVMFLVLNHALEEGESFGQKSLIFTLLGGGMLGSLLYVGGTVIWRGRTALVLRYAGYVLIAAPIALPSTLTLALPFAAALAITLTCVPESSGGSWVAGGRERRPRSQH
jgi:hypothetical protein